MRPHLPFDKRWLRTGTFRLRVMGVALALGTGLTVTAVSASAAVAGHRAPGATVVRSTGSPAIPGQPSTAPAQHTTAMQSTTVTLPTGERVGLESGPGGTQQATPIADGSDNSESTFLRFTWRGDQYVIPDQAVPFLHSVLDPRLFDVSYLARAKLGTGGTGIPVRISYTSTHATASLPGVRVTRRSGATAHATITSTQAARLGRLLASRWRTPRSSLRAAQDGRLPGIREIALAAPPGGPPLPANPTQIPAHTSAAGSSLPYYTLTINATDLNGNPGTFAGIVQNVDDATRYDQTSCFYTEAPYCSFGAATGSESLSVPKGTYSLAFSIETPDPSGSGFDTALVVKPQVTVDSNTTVSLDARTAVPYQAQLSTPVTATQRIDVLQFWRTSVTGGGSGAMGGHLLGVPVFLGLVAISPDPGVLHADTLLATPTAPVTKGSFVFDASSNLWTGSTTAPGPTYTFDFPQQGTVPASLTYTVPAADLTTVQSQIYDTPSACGAEELDTFGFLRLAPGLWERNMYFPTSALPTGPRTDYWYSGDPQLDYWEPGIYTGCVGYYGPPQHIAPGQQISEVWNKTPAAPSPAAPTVETPNFSVPAETPSSDPRLAGCTACRQGDIGTVNILPYADSDPAHYSNQPVFNVGLASYKFYRDGTLAIDSATQGQDYVGVYPWGLELPLLPQAASYELDSSETRPDDSAATVGTDWTFRSGPSDPAAALPSTETCAPDATRACSFLPLLFLRYNLPLSYDDQATAGTSEPIGFTVTSQQNAPAPSGVSATVSASFDGGQTWTTPQAATSLGGGKFTTTISQPSLAATDGSVALRVTATDGSGDSVTQTLIDAYGLTS
jgi:hypothetical protein